MGDEKPPEKSGTLTNPTGIAGWVAGAVGLALGRYAGINLLIPTAIAAVAFVICRWAFPLGKKSSALPISFQFGQFGWMLFAFLIPGGFQQVALDLTLMAAGMIWLYLSMGLPAAIAVIVYNVLSLAIYGYEIYARTVPADGMRGLVVHIAWRIATIALLVLFIRERRAGAAVKEVSDRQRIMAALLKRFPDNGVAPDHFGELLDEYTKSGLSPPHLVAEIETADEQKLWSYVWEAMLYRFLCSAGYTPANTVKKSGQQGPDFCIQFERRTIWIEAVVPSPEGIPQEWLEPPGKSKITVKTKPDAPRVLRCTQAIKAKRDKLEKYWTKGIIGAHDSTVIAVNICRLSDWDIDGTGISQLPLVMEALFPVGPLAVPILNDGTLGEGQHVPRFSIKKAKGNDVEGAFFCDSTFAMVSAVVQAHQKDMHQKELSLATVHNPLASNRLPTGLFHAHKEIVTEQEGEFLRLRDIVKAAK